MNKSPLALLAFTLALLLPATSALAQHGGGAPMQPLPVAEKAPAISVADGVKADAALVALFKEFAECLRTHDGKPFVPRLADNYTIDGYQTDDMKAGFVIAMTMIPAPLEIVVTAVSPLDGSGTLVKTEFKFARRGSKREFTFDAKAKLVTTSLISMKRPLGAGEAPRGH